MAQTLTYDELVYQLKHDKLYHMQIKKSVDKHAQACGYALPIVGHNADTAKASNGFKGVEDTDTVIHRSCVINTTNLFDGHADVHIPKLWNKSLKDNEAKGFYHIKEHRMSFDNIISKGAKGYVKSIAWSDLGADYEGKTEALIFDSTIKLNKANELMFELYKSNDVDQHSVGMRYVSVVVCVNNKDKAFAAEKANWDKYIDQVANRKDAENKGYFYAILEAKVLEGSAVPLGSNSITPTLQNKEGEPSDDTHDKIEPPNGTQPQPKLSGFMSIAKSINNQTKN